MSKQKESVAERLARMQREKEEAAAKAGANDAPGLVSQLTHESDGSPDFSEIAEKLEQRKAHEPKSENDGHVKMTIYVREDLARSFAAICTKRGHQKEFINQAIADFIIKKSRELGIDQ